MGRPFALCLLALACLSATARGSDPLRQGFDSPPPAAWPRTWWHWTKGAVRHEGITKDLEWMKRVGIAGFQLADVNFGGGQEVEPTVDFGSEPWRDALRHAADEAERLGLEMAVFSSPGWSLTGGPWVRPEQAMKKLVWSELRVQGNARGPIPLPALPDSAGPFQDAGAARSRGPGWARDVRVLAYRTPEAERTAPPLPDAIATHAGPIDAALLHDESYAQSLTIDAAPSGEAWIEQRFNEPITVRAVTLAGRGGIPCGRILASVDGRAWRTLVTLPGAQLYRQGTVRTFAIPATTARRFRLEITGRPLRPGETMSEAAPSPAPRYSLSEWRLERGARVHRWEEKAGFRHLFEYGSVAGPAAAPEGSIDRTAVVDLSDKLQPDGRLDWLPPAGEWTLLRLGMSLTGAKNRPATPAGSGYEVDKLNRRHTADYYDAYAQLLRQSVGAHYGAAMRCWLADSWEAGTQNWTDGMIGEFRARRGYDPTPYLPALAGRVVGDSATSERFLWDFRRTLADMFAENHYGVLRERLAADGLLLYSEAAGVSLEIPEDTLLNKSKVDVPMGEFWVRDLHPRLMYLQDVRGAASAAHAYGKPLVAAEAFTGGGYEPPFKLKQVADYWLAQGVNQLVFHTSAHQPLDTLPGNTMVGTHLHRHITWAEQARPLNEYFARTCYLLQQGRPVVDIACLLDEGAPSTPPIWGEGDRPALPAGYKHDYLNADVLLDRLATDSTGRLVLPDGMSYRLLVLPESRQMRPELLEKLRALVAGGAAIVGPRPTGSPSLMGQPAADDRVRRLAEDLWGDLNGTTRTVRRCGKGMVVWGRSIADTLDRLNIAADLAWAGPLDAQVAWTHRRTHDADIYYVSNLTDEPVEIQLELRVANRGAELWRPDTGTARPIEVRPRGELSRVTLAFDRHETLFVVLRGEATNAPAAQTPPERKISEVAGRWAVSFPPQLGAPERITLDELLPLSEHQDPGVKHFSGTARYALRFRVDQGSLSAGQRVWLDLGEVRDLAEATLNGRPLGLGWKPPFRFDATDAIRPGENLLEVAVTNQWNNRIAGDVNTPDQPPVLPGSRSIPRFSPPTVTPSGLLGPVRLVAVGGDALATD